jgi:hypothetical protein
MASHTYRDFDGEVIGGPKPEVSSVSELVPIKLVIRCLLEQVDDDQWQGFSLEFGLAAQAETAQDAKRKLESMIDSYLRDALTGEDRKHAYELLSRKATLAVFVRYYFAWSKIHLARFASGTTSIIYCEPLALEPRPCS